MNGNLRSEAFMTEALDTWGDAVYRLAFAQTHSAADAQDVAQEVFISLLTSDNTFGGHEHLKAWLLRATINRCRDLHRSAWRSCVESLDASACHRETAGERLLTLPDPRLTPEDETVTALTRDPVWEAMKLLPEKQRVAMHLRYVECCNEEQIARIMGCQPATVRTRLHRGRTKLRKLLTAPGAAARGQSSGQNHKTSCGDAGSSPFAPRAPGDTDRCPKAT